MHIWIKWQVGTGNTICANGENILFIYLYSCFSLFCGCLKQQFWMSQCCCIWTWRSSKEVIFVPSKNRLRCVLIWFHQDWSGLTQSYPVINQKYSRHWRRKSGNHWCFLHEQCHKKKKKKKSMTEVWQQDLGKKRLKRLNGLCWGIFMLLLCSSPRFELNAEADPR